MLRFIRLSQSVPRFFSGFSGKAPQIFLHDAFRKLMRLIDVPQQRRALSELEKHLLDDIGVTPAQARREAGKRFWE